MRRVLSVVLMSMLCACGSEAGLTTAPSAPTACDNMVGNMSVKGGDYEVINTVRLTVAEGKRLIAKGLLENEEVKKKLEKGMVIITRGSTNTYIAEEFVDYSKPRGALLSGKILPQGKEDFTKDVERTGEVVIVDGKVVDMSYFDALDRLSDGDIVFKGANLINYDKNQAGVCIGAANGGTVGRLLPYVEKGAARWFVPVGLEKDCSANLFEYSEMLSSAKRRRSATLLTVSSDVTLYTEIEAIKEFADVDVYPAAYGGLDGAEGGVSLIICGSIAEVKKATTAAESVLGEAPFVE